MFLSHGAVARSYSCWICWGLPVCEVNQKWLFCGNEVTHTLLQPELIFKFKQAPRFHAESRQGTSSLCSQRAGQGPAVRGAGRRLLGRLAEPCRGELEPCRSGGAGCALQAPLGRGSARRELAALPSSPACLQLPLPCRSGRSGSAGISVSRHEAASWLVAGLAGRLPGCTQPLCIGPAGPGGCSRGLSGQLRAVLGLAPLRCGPRGWG